MGRAGAGTSCLARGRWVRIGRRFRRPGPMGAAVLAGVLAGAGVSAQPARTDTAPVDTLPVAAPRWEVGLAGVLALPSGEFADYVGAGGGFGLHGAFFLDEGRRLALRLDLAWTVYGHESVRVPLSPTVPWVDVEVTTDNGIGSFSLGPELVLGSGAVRPWIRGSVGVSDFATTSSVQGEGSGEPFATSTNFDDATLALAAGGGLRIALSKGSPYSLALDLGAVHIWHGETEYLRKGGIRAGPAGEIILDTIRSRTNLFAIHVGLTVGLR